MTNRAELGLRASDDDAGDSAAAVALQIEVGAEFGVFSHGLALEGRRRRDADGDEGERDEGDETHRGERATQAPSSGEVAFYAILCPRSSVTIHSAPRLRRTARQSDTSAPFHIWLLLLHFGMITRASRSHVLLRQVSLAQRALSQNMTQKGEERRRRTSVRHGGRVQVLSCRIVREAQLNMILLVVGFEMKEMR